MNFHRFTEFKVADSVSMVELRTEDLTYSKHKTTFTNPFDEKYTKV